MDESSRAPVGKDTTPPVIRQSEVLDPSTVTTTGVSDAPPVAVGVYVAPPTVAPPGAVLVKVMVCDPLPTVNDC